MKKILSISLLFFSLFADAQVDSTKTSINASQIKFIEPPDSTGFGVPDGQLVSKEIGSNGGTIVSDDGKVELIFPPDALTANTNISILPITNLAPNGAGKAYQFEPSGLQFKKPVQIVFHYTDKEAKICPPPLMGLVIQDDTGKWSFFDYDEWDTSAKILKGSIEHFSRGSNSYKFKLNPAKRLVRVEEEIRIAVSGTYRKFPKSAARALTQAELSGFFYKWYVNTDEGGNPSVGTIHSIEDYSCTYKAPARIPTRNPVTVKASTSKGVAPECDIEIYDGYEIKIEGKWSHTPADNEDIEMEITESSSFSLEIQTTESGTTWKVSDLKNDPPSIRIVKCPKGCKCRIVENHCTGMIQIDGISNVKVSNSTVTVLFQNTQASFPLMETTCKNKNVPFTPKAPAVPARMVFGLTGDKQVIPFDFGADIFPIRYTFTIERRKN